MEKALITSKLLEIENLISRKQFTTLEKKIFDLSKNIDFAKDDEYELYIKAILLYIESFLKRVQTLKALEEIEKYHKQLPYEEKFLEKMYEISTKLKRLSKIEYSLKALINLFPNNIHYRLNLVDLHIKNKNYSDVVNELAQIVNIEPNNITLNKIYLYWLSKEGSISEQLRTIIKLQELLPDDTSLITDEIKILLALGKFENAFEMINNYLKYKLENNIIDFELLESFIYFSDVYLFLSCKNLFLEVFIKILLNFSQFDSKSKTKLKEFSKQKKLEFIFNFFTKNKINESDFDEKNLIENILWITQNKGNFDEKEFSIEKILFQMDKIKKYIPIIVK